MLDNYGTHKTAMIHDWRGWSATLPPALHAHEHLLNQPSRTFVRCDYRAADPARYAPQQGELEQAIQEYLAVYNEDPKPFIWTKSADQILESLKFYCEGMPETGH